MMEATSYVGNVETLSGHVMGATVSDDERLGEIIVELIHKNGRVRQAIMDLVLSSPYVEWEL